MPVPRNETIAVTDLEHVAIAAPPTGSHDHTVADGAHGCARGRGVVRSLVLLPDAEDGMVAATERRGDSPELERCAEERSPQRLATRVEEVAAHRIARITNRLQLGARERERRREDFAHSHRAARRRRAFGHDAERVT